MWLGGSVEAKWKGPYEYLHIESENESPLISIDTTNNNAHSRLSNKLSSLAHAR